jgi:LPS export ABC transporter permease LptF/LPS export ABC transporter permease LptG
MAVYRLLSRYVARELLTSTSLAVALWTSVLLMNRFFLVAGEALQRDLGAVTTLRFFLLFVPNALVLAIPMGTILGTLVAIGRLSSDQEILAMETAGYGPASLTRTVLLHGLLMTLAAFLVYGWVHPFASYEIRRMRVEMISASAVAADLRPRVFYQNLPGMVLYVDERLPGDREAARGVLLFQEESGGLEQLFIAKRGRLLEAPGSGSIGFELEQGVLHVYRSQQPESYRPTRFDRFRPPPVEIFPGARNRSGQEVQRGVTDMGFPQLFDQVRGAETESDAIIRRARERGIWTEIHSRLALPFSCFVFALLALPLGVTRARSGKGAGFALSLGIILVYWLIYTYGRQNLAIDGDVPVAVALWAANVLVGAWGVLALARMGRPEAERLGWIRRGTAALVRALRAASRRPAEPPTDEAEAPAVAPSGRPWFRPISLVDLYVVRTYLRVFLLAVAAAYLIFALVEIRDVLEGVLQGGHPLSMLVRYYVFFTPGALRIVVPIACLIGASVTCAMLSRSSEITAMKAAGLSIRRISAPILLVTALIGVGHFLVQDRIAPESNRRAQQIKDEFQGRSPRTYGIAPGGRWTFGTEGRLYHYRLYDPEKRAFQGLSVFRVRFDPPAILEHGFSLGARWSDESGSWMAERGWVRTFPADGGAPTFRTFTSEPAALDPPGNFERRERSVLAGNELAEWLSLSEIEEEIAALSGSGYDTTRLRVAFHRQLAELVVPLVMVVLGLPFAFRVGRRGSLYGIGVALVLVLVYWATWAIANALGLQDLVPPAAAAWAPNALWAAVGSVMLYGARS